MSQTNFSRYKYMPDNMNEVDFLARFVVRQEIFEDIFNDIKNTNFDVPAQHQIIVGQRGQGKTTLLRRLEIAVRDDELLSKFLLTAKFPEEQNNIRFLSRFWEEIAITLEDFIGDVYGEMVKHAEDTDYDMENFGYLEKALKAKNKKVLVLMDNIDIFLDTLKEKEQQRLREILLTSSSLLIVGGSTQMLEQHYDYNKQFYQFFKITTLEGLNKEEMVTLLRVIARDNEKEKIEAVIKSAPEKIEALRQLTGGIPRLGILLFDILIDNHGLAFSQMEKLLDEITPFYQDRLGRLPATLKDITHSIAMNWDGMETAEIAKKTRLTSSEASSQLQQLKKYHFIESVSIGKNNIYKIKERFFNIWYLMRYGRKKDKERVEWLVKFLTTWYSKDELRDRSEKFINLLKTSNVNDSYAYIMGEALRYCVADIDSECELKNTMQTYLNTNRSSLANDISPSYIETMEKIIKLREVGKIDEAIALLEKSKKRLPQEDLVLGVLYSEQKNYDKAEKYFLKAVESGIDMALLGLGILYKEQKNYDKAEEYYLKALESGDNEALGELAWIYFELAKKPIKALEYANKCVENERNFYYIYALTNILLWNENFSDSYEIFTELLGFKEASENVFLYLYLSLLIAKGQYYKAKEFLEIEEYRLKERYKPIWYALMTLMQNDFPNEIKKMGSELQESVNSVLDGINDLKTKYQI